MSFKINIDPAETANMSNLDFIFFGSHLSEDPGTGSALFAKFKTVFRDRNTSF